MRLEKNSMCDQTTDLFEFNGTGIISSGKRALWTDESSFPPQALAAGPGLFENQRRRSTIRITLMKYSTRLGGAKWLGGGVLWKHQV